MFRSIGELDPWARLLLWKQEGRNRQALLPRVPLLETNWVVNWGGTNRMTEFTASNKPVIAIDFGGHRFGYRSFPIPHGRISAQQLRKGMDAILTTGRGEIAAQR